MEDVVAIDCKKVTIAGGHSACGRCTIVDHRQKVIYDTFVRPERKVTDYRTHTTGLQAHHLDSGAYLSTVRREVS